MSRFLYRLGRNCANHRRIILLAWLVVVVGLFVGGNAAGGGFEDAFSVPGVDSQKATDLLQNSFPGQGGGSAQVVFHTTSGKLTDSANASAVSATVTQIGGLPDVVAAPDPLARGGQVSQDGTIALTTVQYDETSLALPSETYGRLKDAVTPATDAGMTVDFGGDLPSTSAATSASSSEFVGIVAAMVILLLAFGSVIAMGLPIGTALFGLGSGIALITFMSAFVDMPSTVEALSSMIGIGVGIDYSLFIITRFRTGLHRGLTVEDAIGRSIATAGQAVVVAGTTVVIAILGLAVAGIPFVTYMGFGAAVTVAVMVVAALTLLPALMGFAGHNVDRFGIPGTKVKLDAGARDEHGNYHGWVRWSHHVGRHPWVYMLASLGVVLLLAIPTLSMRLGQPDASADPTSSTLRRSYDLLADAFGPGFNGPLVVAVDIGSADGQTLLPEITKAVAADPDVASVAPAQTSPNGTSAAIEVVPKSSPQDPATGTLVHRLRDDVLPTVTTGTGAQTYIGGETALFIDLSNKIASRLVLFIAVIIGLSFLLLMAVFRSIAIPIKAALMNVLSIGAAYGVMVAVFQWNWGSGIFGVHHSLPIVSFVPMFMFAILFGLSMDYEVFLLSRIREEYLKSGDTSEAVVEGISTTARVITSAALIMISVFLSFVFGGEPTIQMIGLGLAVAILIDATLIRMVLVPSVMELLGDANWWFPKWLDRIIPNLDIEGESKLPPEELEAPPEPATPVREPVPAI